MVNGREAHRWIIVIYPNIPWFCTSFLITMAINSGIPCFRLFSGSTLRSLVWWIKVPFKITVCSSHLVFSPCLFIIVATSSKRNSVIYNLVYCLLTSCSLKDMLISEWLVRQKDIKPFFWTFKMPYGLGPRQGVGGQKGFARNMTKFFSRLKFWPHGGHTAMMKGKLLVTHPARQGHVFQSGWSLRKATVFRAPREQDFSSMRRCVALPLVHPVLTQLLQISKVNAHWPGGSFISFLSGLLAFHIFGIREKQRMLSLHQTC